MEKVFLTEIEVSATFGLGLRHLRALRASGKGPRFFKTSGKLGTTGGRVCYKPSDVQAWIESRQSGGEHPTGGRV